MQLKCLAFVLALAAIPIASLANETNVREQKLLSLFSVVSFPNGQCTSSSDSTTLGTCYSTTECSDKGGTSGGNCASGFGVCCVFEVSACGGTVSQNCTYISNSGYPSSITTASQTCTYTVSPVSSDICQLRLDFTNFVLPITSTTGACNGALTITSTTLKAPPSICGTNTGEHVYVENGQSTSSTSIAVTTGTGTSSRSWKIKITQVECTSQSRAPDDCVQYFTGTSGTFQSFNFDGGLLVSSLAYNICFRREVGYCAMDFKEDPGQTSPDPFDLITVPANTAIERETCTIGRLYIPHTTSGGQFCGGMFGIIQSDTSPGTIRLGYPPFKIGFSVGSPSVTSSIGFKMVYSQVPC